MQAIDRRVLLAMIASAAASVLLPTDAAAVTQRERTGVRGMVQNEAAISILLKLTKDVEEIRNPAF